MCSKLTRKKLVVLLCTSIIMSFSNVSQAKIMYVKKTVTAKTAKGEKIIIPKYASAKVKYTTKPIQTSTPTVEETVQDILNGDSNITEIYEELVPLNAIPTIKLKKTIKHIKIDGKKVKIKKKYLTSKEPLYDNKTVPYNGIKSYMSYRAITATGSAQYKLQYKAYTDYKTGVRMVDGRYCIAMGSSAATKIGTKIDLIFQNGKVVHAILGDQKAGTSGGWLHADGSAVEFLVDMNALPSSARRMGDMSVLKKFKGRVIKIKVFKRRKKKDA